MLAVLGLVGFSLGCAGDLEMTRRGLLARTSDGPPSVSASQARPTQFGGVRTKNCGQLLHVTVNALGIVYAAIFEQA